MFGILLILFIIVPIVELYILVEVGQQIGALNTIAIVIITGIAGASFARSQGTQILYKIRSTMNEGQIPGKELLQGVMILAGGIMLLTPGFITDILGLTLIFPLTRQFYMNVALAYFRKRFTTYRGPGV